MAFGIMIKVITRKEENMLKSKPILLVVVVLLIASLACASPTIVSLPDQNFVDTTIAQTVIVALTQTAQPLIPNTGSGSPTNTFTPEPPTLTLTATLSPTPIFTTTPLVPQISVSMATNCRVGPGKAYDRVGALMIGEVAEVFGKDSTGTYWYIRNPDSGGEYCWLWGAYASFAGNLAGLPIYTPPPTPTPIPAFKASYNGLDICAGWWVDIKLTNTGALAFRSVSIALRDTVTDTILVLSADNFTNNDGCSSSSTKATLDPGSNRVVSMPSFAYDPTGHALRATITVCSNKGISGACVSQVITFTP